MIFRISIIHLFSVFLFNPAIFLIRKGTLVSDSLPFPEDFKPRISAISFIDRKQAPMELKLPACEKLLS